MKDSEIYRRAAEHVADKPLSPGVHRCGCGAIRSEADEAGYNPKEKEALVNKFAALFKPEDYGQHSMWFGPCEDAENQEPRILALCFMAAMADR